MRDEVGQHAEHLGLELHLGVAHEQLQRAGVEDVVAEAVPHGGVSVSLAVDRGGWAQHGSGRP